MSAVDEADDKQPDEQSDEQPEGATTPRRATRDPLAMQVLRLGKLAVLL